MNGKLTANCFTCSQGYLRLIYYIIREIRRYNKAKAKQSQRSPSTSFLASQSPPASQDLDAQIAAAHKKDCQKML